MTTAPIKLSTAVLVSSERAQRLEEVKRFCLREPYLPSGPFSHARHNVIHIRQKLDLKGFSHSRWLFCTALQLVGC